MNEQSKAERVRHKVEVMRNRTVLERIVDALMVLCSQGLFLRGHKENIIDESTIVGTFLDIIKLWSRYGTCLDQHLMKVKD